MVSDQLLFLLGTDNIITAFCLAFLFADTSFFTETELFSFKNHKSFSMLTMSLVAGLYMEEIQV